MISYREKDFDNDRPSQYSFLIKKMTVFTPHQFLPFKISFEKHFFPISHHFSSQLVGIELHIVANQEKGKFLY